MICEVSCAMWTSRKNGYIQKFYCCNYILNRKKTCRKRELDRYAKILNVIILMNSMSIQIFTELFEMIIIFNESLGMKKATCGAIMSDDLEDIFFIADFSII